MNIFQLLQLRLCQDAIFGGLVAFTNTDSLKVNSSSMKSAQSNEKFQVIEDYTYFHY